MALCVHGRILPMMPTLPRASTPADTHLNQYLRLKAEPQMQQAALWSNSKHGLVVPVFNSSLARNISDVQRVALLSRLGGCIWYYSGVLRSPSTGSELVGVHGLEFVRQLDLHNSGGSYVSRKVFVYTDLSDKNNSMRAVKQYRVRPTAPQRRVRPSKIFNEIISLQIDSSAGKVFASIHFPSKRRIVSTKFTLIDNIATLPQRPLLRITKALTSRRNSDFSIMTLIKGVGSAAASNNTRNTNKWISFASPEDSIHGRSQEHYRISSSSSLAWGAQPRGLLPGKGSRAYLSYKRYGEGPPWYLPGRSVLTELQAAKFETSALAKGGVPHEVLRLICEECPDFFPTDTYFVDSRRDYLHHTMNWFHGERDTYDDYKVWWKRILGK